MNEIERICQNCERKDGEGFCSVLGYALGEVHWLQYRGQSVKPAFDDGCNLFEPSVEALEEFRQDCAEENALTMADADKARRVAA
ncbi:MAG: hypothetical protein HQK81_10905 [Desulfovibrionaceae bacterium]|nr:hypothetical protein [Desulfovibrionaceae bacterium]MBF0514550.1 hypothetical protein [Desulfovibrionaceae bacterium]